MARTFHSRPQARPIAELNVTNLIDLGFTLLIIFMLATTLTREQTIPVQLPTEAKSPQVKPEQGDHFVSISIDAKGNYYIDNRPTPIGYAELRTRLQSYAAQPKPPIIRIRGDLEAHYGKFVQLLSELKKVNMLKITFDTETEE